MSTIFAQVKGNRIGTRILGDLGGVKRIRETRSARLAQCGNVIDIDP
jgi:hypothetical protein